jgi:hypothetical protein
VFGGYDREQITRHVPDLPAWEASVRDALASLWASPRPVMLLGHSAVDVGASTAFVDSADPVRLLVRLAGWSEGHLLIEEPERVWVAGILRDGLGSGVIRGQVNGYPQRWEAAVALLDDLASHPGPVVTSNSHGWGMPDLHLIDEYGDDSDRARLTPDQAWLNARRASDPAWCGTWDDDELTDAFREELALPDGQLWDMSLRALRAKATRWTNHRLHPGTFAQPFCPTAYDVRAAIEADRAARNPDRRRSDLVPDASGALDGELS